MGFRAGVTKGDMLPSRYWFSVEDIARPNRVELAGSLKQYFGFSVSGQLRRQPPPVLKVLAYSFGIVAVFFVGTILESRLRYTGFGEALGAIPVLVGPVDNFPRLS